jgi:ubiquinone/menaquinone biosynthesis C-methylase UbiE
MTQPIKQPIKQEYSEAQVAAFYDTTEKQQELPWNPDGSKHWGYFDDFEAPDNESTLVQACDRWNHYMLSHGQIDGNSSVLDVGCGHGHSAVYLARTSQCAVVGLDLSHYHIEAARAKAQNFADLSLTFHQGSATDLPFDFEAFSHVWSQGTFLHIHPREVALAEVYRVLAPGGLFLLEDLVVKVPQVSQDTLQYVYQRLHVTEPSSLETYPTLLTQAGFKILKAEDLSLHMAKTYRIQAKRVRGVAPAQGLAYQKTGEAVEAGEIGWGFYVCQKP